ncbi:MAG: hypothetical protein LBC67_00075 [Spirochaetales bacterium]|nr:hypothetical protein [Spirochaetales bacterium]
MKEKLSVVILLTAYALTLCLIAACPEVPTEAFELPKSIENVENLPSVVQPGHSLILGFTEPLQASRAGGQYAADVTDYRKILIDPLNATVLKDLRNLDIEWGFCSALDEVLGPIPGSEEYIEDEPSIRSVEEPATGHFWRMELQPDPLSGKSGKRRAIHLIPPPPPYVPEEGSEYVYLVIKIRDGVYFRGGDIISDYIQTFKVSVDYTPLPAYIPVIAVTNLPARLGFGTGRDWLLYGKDKSKPDAVAMGASAQSVPNYGPITIMPPEATVLQSGELEVDWGFLTGGMPVYISSTTGGMYPEIVSDKPANPINGSAASSWWRMGLVPGGTSNRVVQVWPTRENVSNLHDTNGSRFVDAFVRIKNGIAPGRDYVQPFRITRFEYGSPPAPQPQIAGLDIWQCLAYHFITLPTGAKNAASYTIRQGETFHWTGVYTYGSDWTAATAQDALGARKLEIIPGTTTARFVKTFQETTTYPSPYAPGNNHDPVSIKPSGTGNFRFRVSIPPAANSGAAIVWETTINVTN